MNLPTQHNENENNESILIPYQASSTTRELASMVVTALALLLIAYLTIGFEFISYLYTLNFDSGLIFLALVSATLIYFLMFKLTYKNQPIRISDKEIEFPSVFAPDLLFRQTRKWDDVSNILLGAMMINRDKTTYEYELESSKNQKKVFIYFKSGGHATVDLTKLNKAGSEILFQKIESWCLDFSRTPQEKKQEASDSQKIDSSSIDINELPGNSYTEIWESGLADQFSSTNFVPLKKGDIVQAGRFKIIMQLAAGGLSAVYLAESHHKELRVLKECVVPKNLNLQDKARELFKREVTLLQKIDHPNIAKVIDCFVDNNRDYTVLEYIQGNTLKDQVGQFGPIEEVEALNHTIEIAKLVEYLHSMQPSIIHRDISPSNLILKKDGSICLIDFGAANQLISTATGTLVGKQSYMAPEQFRGKPSKASDLYGIGTTLFFLLTGRDPTPLEESCPREINKQISPLTDNLVSSCTKQTVDNRISSTTDLIKEVSHILEHGGGAVIETGGKS